MKKLSTGAMFSVPPLSAVMKLGGPGVAVKVKGWPLPPIVKFAVVGLTVIDVTFPTTVAVAVALMPWALAVNVAVPGDIPVRVALPVPTTVATSVVSLDQPTPLVICDLVLSL